MRIGQRETRAGVIECRIRPRNCVVALRTERRWETRRNVIGHASAKRRRAVPRRLMAPVAIRVRGGEVIVVIDVAVRAGVHLACRSHLVGTRQGPPSRGVVEGRCQKRYRVVAVGAVGRCKGRSCRGMRRAVCPLPAASVVRVQMTLRVSAIRRLNLQIVVVVDVAISAGRYLACRRQLVRIRQRESGCGVIKGRVLPRDRVMAI